MALPGFRPAQHRSGGVPRVEHKAPASGETFLAGDVVRLIVDNTVKTAADNETTAFGVALGDAVVDGTLVAAVPIAVFDGQTFFSGDNSGTTLALATHIGDDASLQAAAAGAHSVDVGTAGNALFEIVGEDTTDNDAAGTGNRVLVAVAAAKSQAMGYGTAAPDAS